MIAIDASVLIDYIHRATPEETKLRLKSYLYDLDKKQARIVIPAPAFCEFMARAGRAEQAYQQILALSRSIDIKPFAERASRECAVMIAEFKTKRDKLQEGQTWAKAKFDWQIVAIAKVEGSEEILTRDRDIHALAKKAGLRSRTIDELPLSDQFRQRRLPLPTPQDYAQDGV